MSAEPGSEPSPTLARRRFKVLSVDQLEAEARQTSPDASCDAEEPPGDSDQVDDDDPDDDEVDEADLPPRPQTRADCASVPRPCPYVSCRYHLYLDVNAETGSLRLNFPALEPADLQHSCALDVADGVDLNNLPTFAEVGRKLNVTRERIRMMVRSSLTRVAPSMRHLGLHDPDLK